MSEKNFDEENLDDSENINGLEMNENHFSQKSIDLSNLETAHDLEAAIVKCKEDIMSLEETSEKKRLLVQHLVKLRLKLQDVQELEIYSNPKNVTIVQSHKFVSQSITKLKFNTSQLYCETCMGLIWIPIQSWFCCSGKIYIYCL